MDKLPISKDNSSEPKIEKTLNKIEDNTKKGKSGILDKNIEISKKLSLISTGIKFLSINILKPLTDLNKTTKESLENSKKQAEIAKNNKNNNTGVEIVKSKPEKGKKEKEEKHLEKPSLFGKIGKIGAVSGLISGFISALFGKLGKALSFLKIGGIVVAGVVGVGKALFDSFKYMIHHKNWDFGDLVKEFFASLINFFSFGFVSKSTAKSLMNKIEALIVSNIINPLTNFFKGIWNLFSTKFPKTTTFIKNWFNLYIKYIKSLFNFMIHPIDSIKNMFESISTFFSSHFPETIKFIEDWFNSGMKKIKDLFNFIMHSIDSIKNMFESIGTFFSSHFPKVTKFIKGWFNLYIKYIKGLFQLMTHPFDTIKSFFISIGSFFDKNFPKTTKILKNVISSITDFFKKIKDKLLSFEPDWMKTMFSSKKPDKSDSSENKKSEATEVANKHLSDTLIKQNFSQNDWSSKLTGRTDEISEDKLKKITKHMSTNAIKVLLDSGKIDKDNEKQLQKIYNSRIKESIPTKKIQPVNNIIQKEINPGENKIPTEKNTFSHSNYSSLGDMLNKPITANKNCNNIKVQKDKDLESDIDSLKVKTNKNIGNEILKTEPKEKERCVPNNINTIDASKKSNSNVSIQNNSFDKNIYSKHGLKRIG